jgi:RNA polymerase sigma-70 factor (ECF subfamily)
MDRAGPSISEPLASALHREAEAGRWSLSVANFAAALAVSAHRGAAGTTRGSIERYLRALHLRDLALACACAAGNEAAWEHFVREYRPLLRRAADALDHGGSARDLADALYAELYGIRDTADGNRRSLFGYFHGRSSLATWLRAVLSQRHVDAVRARRRLEPLPEEDSPLAIASTAPLPADPDRYRLLALIQRALKLAVAALPARDRLRLSCYYTQGLNLAQTGRLLTEHEATVSRHLARTRAEIRREIERSLHRDAGLTDDEVARAFEYARDDPGSINLQAIGRKNVDPDRSV